MEGMLARGYSARQHPAPRITEKICLEHGQLNRGGESMGKFGRFVLGLSLGAVIGAGLVVLLTPQSGEELRQQVRDKIEAVKEEGQRAAEERRAELLAQFEELKKSAPRA
jgi:hypothetical protein